MTKRWNDYSNRNLRSVSAKKLIILSPASVVPTGVYPRCVHHPRRTHTTRCALSPAYACSDSPAYACSDSPSRFPTSPPQHPRSPSHFPTLQPQHEPWLMAVFPDLPHEPPPARPTQHWMPAHKPLTAQPLRRLTSLPLWLPYPRTSRDRVQHPCGGVLTMSSRPLISNFILKLNHR
jgi:hypothetical protein